MFILPFIILPTAQAQQAPQRLPLFGTFETSFAVPGDYTNPYDPQQVEVTATFTDPGGLSTEVPGFYIQPYQDSCNGDCSAEQLEPSGDGEWRVRFTPTIPGTWRYTISAFVASEPVPISNGRFEVEDNQSRGFVRVAANNQYFVFDDNTPYFPIGQNLGWSWENGGGIYTYLDWLDHLHTAHANYARIYIDVPWFIGLEWASPPGQYDGAGQEAAWRFDTILQAAAERNIYLQVVLIWNQAFREYTGVPVTIPQTPPRPNTSQDFDNHPYNVRQGGNLPGPGDILMNSIAQGWLRQRLRYIAARWGYSTHIFAWEIVDEIDRIAAFNAERDTAWLSTMINTLHEHDPNRHLVTVGTRSFQSVIQQNELLDFSQVELYQTRPIEQANDQVQVTLNTLSETRSQVSRPVLINEFSLNPWFEPTLDDPNGIHIHNTIWATALSGAAGSAMPWWWDTYIDQQDLYGLYTPLALFTQDIAWNELAMEPVNPRLVSNNTVDYAPLRIDDFNRQFRSPTLPEDTVFQITADGAIPPTSQMPSYLYGQRYSVANRQPQTLRVSPPIDTLLTIGIRNVSTAADAQLVVRVDGVDAARLDLSAGTDTTSISIPIMAGIHTIVLDNLGDDWLQLEYLELDDYRAPLRTVALADIEQGVAVIWIHHRDYTWEAVQTDTPLTAMNFRLELPGMPAGIYRVEYWNTFNGSVIGEERVILDTEGTLAVRLLPIKDQLALRLFRIAGPGE